MFRKKRKQIKRKIFGFPCDTGLIFTLKAVIGNIPSPIYPAMEHICQLGARAAAVALQNEQTRRNLEEHILKEHLLVPSIVKDSDYDIRVMAKAELFELQRQEFEKFTGEFMKICDLEDIDPQFLLDVAKSWIKKLRDRRQREDDVPRRW